MSESNELHDASLVAVWPGMGSVALIAGSYLLQHLSHVRHATELDASGLFEIKSIEVKNGIATAGPLPHNIFFEWKNPRGGQDLLLFIGEAQPTSGGYQLCQEIVDYAIGRGVKRLFTFASMATQLQLGDKPHAFAVATDAPSLERVKDLDVAVLDDGQITGLNGVLLAAGAERGLPGTCLMGEIPFFASGVPNPRAAQVVLECFTELAGIEIDFTGLREQAELVERQLEHLLEQMQDAAQSDTATEAEEEADEEGPEVEVVERSQPEQISAPPLDQKTQRKIEALFEDARRERSKAFALKRELDRLGVFKRYEDRFLDLFRGAG